MRTIKTIILFLLLGLGISNSIRSQDEAVNQPLKEILSGLEDRLGYQFNFLDEVVQNIELLPPSSDLTIEGAINYLRRTTGLIFTPLDGKIVSITKRGETTLSICGMIIDMDTQQPLVSATIQGNGGSVLSDGQGFFRLNINSENDLITIRFLGYKSITRQAQFFSDQNCKPIYLIPSETTLPEIILSNYLVEGINKLNSGALEINFDEFSLLPGLIETDVLQSIQAFPGIQSVNETVSNLNIRGGTHDQNYILWDGIKMYQSGHFFGLISAFNPHITQKVTLQKNGTHPMYSDGVSGTISMETAPELSSNIHGNIGVNLIDGSGFIDLPIGDKSSLQVAARKSISSLVTTPTYDSYFQRIAQDSEILNNVETVVNSDQQFDFYDASLRWNYQISSKDKIRVNFMQIANELVFQESAQSDLEATSRESSITQNNLGAGIKYERNWSDHFKTTFQIYETDYKLKAINVNVLDNQRFLQENEVSETGITAMGDWYLSAQLGLSVGYQFLETEITNLDDVDVPLVRTLISNVVRTHAGFSQLTYSPNDGQTRLDAGLRYSYLDKFKRGIIEPRINFHQALSKNFSLDIAGERKHQITSQVINFQNDFLGVEKRRWQMANDEDIPVITSYQGSAGFSFQNRGWLLNVEGFYKKVDGITAQSQGFLNQFEFAKTDGSYSAIGMDLLLRKRFKSLNIWLGYSYLDAQYTFDELLAEEFPSNLDLTHSITAGASYRLGAFKIAAGWNYHTGVPATPPVPGAEVIDGAINYAVPNSDRLADYSRLDGSATYGLAIGERSKLELAASVWNILDRNNEVSNYFRLDAEGNPTEFVQQSLDLTTNFALRFYF